MSDDRRIGDGWSAADWEHWIATGLDPSGVPTSPAAPALTDPARARRRERDRQRMRGPHWKIITWPASADDGPNAVAIVRGTWSEGHFAFEATVCAGPELHVAFVSVRSDLGTAWLRPHTDPIDRTQGVVGNVDEPATAPVTAGVLRSISTRDILLAAKEDLPQHIAWRRSWALEPGAPPLDPVDDRLAEKALRTIRDSQSHQGRPHNFDDEFDQQLARRYLEVTKAAKRGVHRVLADEWSERLGEHVSIDQIHNWLKRLATKDILVFAGGGRAGATPGANYRPAKAKRTSSATPRVRSTKGKTHGKH